MQGFCDHQCGDSVAGMFFQIILQVIDEPAQLFRGLFQVSQLEDLHTSDGISLQDLIGLPGRKLPLFQQVVKIIQHLGLADFFFQSHILYQLLYKNGIIHLYFHLLFIGMMLIQLLLYNKFFTEKITDIYLPFP